MTYETFYFMAVASPFGFMLGSFIFGAIFNVIKK